LAAMNLAHPLQERPLVATNLARTGRVQGTLLQEDMPPRSRAGHAPTGIRTAGRGITPIPAPL